MTYNVACSCSFAVDNRKCDATIVLVNNTVNEVLEFVKENDVKFVRLGFCDLFGTQKNISMMADECRNRKNTKQQ